MYILEAGLEYLISILVAGAYLAKLTASIGISDEITGILSSVIALGHLFQLGSIFIRPKRSKSFVVIFSVINQLLFMALYLIPGISIPKEIKSALFVVVILSAYILYNLAHPKKINWLMSLVDDKIRGRFTSIKEIVSLVMGIVFTMAMGAVIDHFEAKGEVQMAFILCAITIFAITVLHTLTMLLSVEKEQSAPAKKGSAVFAVLKDKNILKIALIFALYYASTHSAVPFYGTYQTKELGFSMFFISLLSFLGSGVRIAFSFLLGNFADKRSFSVMLRLCMAFLGAAYFFNIFATPANGKLMFTIYTILQGVAMAGCNSALINLVYDYVEVERRADAIAVTQAVSGVVGFMTTLAISPLISLIQKQGGLFGMNFYAQQAASFIAFAFCGATILYITAAFGRKAKK